MSNFLSKTTVDQLAERFSGFDFEAAMSDIMNWQSELGTDYDDSVTFNVLESVLDIIIDRSEF